MTTTVDEERWCAGDAAEVGTVNVLCHARRGHVVAKLVGERLTVETELPRVADEVVELERVLMR